MSGHHTQPEPVPKLSRKVRELEASVRHLELLRERDGRRRQRRMLSAGVAVSLIAHVGLIIFLASMSHGARGGSQPGTETFEFAILSEAQLTELQVTPFEQIEPTTADAFANPEPSIDPADLSRQADAPSMEMAAGSSMPTLAGAGDGSAGVEALTGGGASTSFFGIRSQGTRFAYILDVSRSMGQQGRMRTAIEELRESIRALPDFAHFYIIMFSDELRVPPQQRGWTRARAATVRRVGNWLGDVVPSGGTEPAPAFHQVFALDVRPDVIFFMTDGDIQTMSAAEVAELNRRGKRVLINTVAFGDPSSQELLRAIARDSGGTYQFVSSEE